MLQPEIATPEIIPNSLDAPTMIPVSKPSAIDLLARRLAAHYVTVTPTTTAGTTGGTPTEPLLMVALVRQEQRLALAYKQFSSTPREDVAPSSAAEWLLDNYFVVQQTIRQVREDMPRKFYIQLPVLQNPALQRIPRIYALAHETNLFNQLRLNIEDDAHFLAAFQAAGITLTMGELWAFPTMLRLDILDTLTRTLEPLLKDVTERPAGQSAPVDESIVGDCITSLRMLAIQDWKVFFEHNCVVERILTLDPAGVYTTMDFDTRNRYRTTIERLARRSGITEESVAHQVVTYSTDPQRVAPANHIGYWLIGDGHDQFETAVGYKPNRRVTARRWLLAHPARIYLGSILTLMTLFVLISLALSTSLGGSLSHLVVAALLTLLPCTTIAVAFVNWSVMRNVPPRTLPRLDFQAGIPENCQTIVVIPSLLTDADEVASLLQQLELHYLRNTDPQLYFGLLTDYADAASLHLPTDAALVAQAQTGIEALNLKYAPNPALTHERATSPFYLFHRDRQWNAKQDTWMGWERKRGKLVEFNHLLQGKGATAFSTTVGDLAALTKIRYVITLDSDSILPEESARRLIATLAHPLNQAQFDPVKGKVVSGYGILQPRVEIKPTSANQSLFTQIFAGDIGLDLYTRAVSDVYQDFFGEGSYVGKGIYDVATFEAAVAGRVPENALLSHDLFEGIWARVALVTDIVLFEEYPASYLSHTRRLHRWIRGDWQLLPWLLPTVPTAQTHARVANPLAVLDRWKILDNLRRSLITPALLVLFICAWLGLLGPPLPWMLLGLATLGFPLFMSVFASLRGPMGTRTIADVVRSYHTDFWRWLLALVFLPYEALLSFDAVGVTLIRLFIRQNQLLRWTTAANTARHFGNQRGSSSAWREMQLVPWLVVIMTVAVGLVNPSALLIAAPLLVAWLVSPQVAYLISRPLTASSPTFSPSTAEQMALRQLARQTWLFFEQVVGPEDHWLPPDHFQEAPRAQTAHRTSPTNIGMLLVSTLSAYDFGYIGLSDLVARVRATFDTFGQLERYRGHLLNWYDTQTLVPLEPRYVSAVDSGNLAGGLIVIKQACLALLSTNVISSQRWTGLIDTLGMLNASLTALDPLQSEESNSVILAHTALYLAELQLKIERQIAVPAQWATLITWLSKDGWAELSRLIMARMTAEGAAVSSGALANVRVSAERVHHHIVTMKRDLERFWPWLTVIPFAPAAVVNLTSWNVLLNLLASASSLPAIEDLAMSGGLQIDQLLAELNERGLSAEELTTARAWCESLREQVASGVSESRSLSASLHALVRQAEDEFQAMDFGFLYNTQRKVFYIGYNVTVGRLDDNCYDLLASESRLGSLLAIAKRDVPQTHWLHLGRPVTSVVNTRTLLSWSGTMFEYLMPTLLMESVEQTFLTQSCKAAVDYQIAFGREKHVPWGISESSYYAFDGGMTYQYHAFGVPGLGFQRGIEDDLVIAPYASLLALSIRPEAVLHNLQHLDALSMRGRYGLFESVDYSKARLPKGQTHAVIQSYMAHHQGMILVSLCNYLLNNSIITRFHADPAVQSVAMLLQERVPTQAPIEYPHHDEVIVQSAPQLNLALDPWSVMVDAPLPQVHVLSNGRFSTMLTSAGSGFSQWQGVGLTRWSPDSTRDDWGTWIYIQDQDTGELWSAGYQPTSANPDNQLVRFYAHQAEFERRDHGIQVHVLITVAVEDDLEIRQITLINDSNRKRNLRIVSYAEVLLASQTEPHPAFNKLFVENEFLPEHNLLIFHRRPRAADEPSIYLGHMLVASRGDSLTGGHQGDKRAFIGRGQNARDPFILQDSGRRFSGGVGITLDPIFSLGQEVVLPQHALRRVALLTFATRSRHELISLAERYKSWPTIARAFDAARHHHEQALYQLRIGAHQLAQIERLLSALLYPYAGWRGNNAALLANTKGQSSLWAYSISGDFPILLLRITDAAELSLAQELLLAHAHWHSQQIMIDLVILNLHESSYSQEFQGQINRLVLRTSSAAWLNRRGGVFILNADQMNEPDRILLHTIARVVLDGRDGGLADQLVYRADALTRLPLFTPVVFTAEVPESTPALPPPSGLRFENGYGGFTPDGREYAIFLRAGQTTPAPWVNIIANDSLGFLVSESGAGYTWADNSSQNRLTPWNNDPVSDGGGEALYLRDEETAQVWSPMPAPTRDAEPYLIRHGAGYTQFEHRSRGLGQTTRLYVAPDEPVKIIRLRLENLWQRPRRVTVTYYAEWVLGTTRSATQATIVPEYDHQSGALLARNAYNTEFGEKVAFLAANKAPHGLTTDRMEFIGRMGDLSRPAALNRIGLSSKVEAGGDPCAVLQLHVDLPVGGSEEIYFLLGEGVNREHALQLIQRYQDAAQVETAWQATHTLWDSILGTLTVQTPDPALDIMLNRWLLYQTLACRIWARTGFYQSSGAFGYRDQLQDVLALLALGLPQRILARDHILNAAQHQFEAGDVLHWWHPPTGRGVRTRFSDDLLWLPYVVAAYIETTGDSAILEMSVPFLRGEPLREDEDERYAQFESTVESFSLYEHCLRAIQHGSTIGQHGLPLMGSGDWNDGMSRVGIEGRGESVWVGWFLYDVLLKIAPLCDQHADRPLGDSFREQAARLKTALAASAWDGRWYRRAYYDDGSPLGSALNIECRIDSIAQSWAVISGAGETARVEQAMQSVADYLIRPADRLVRLFTPPFDTTPHDPGYIKGYPRGIRENGGQYTHAATWVAWAFAMLGDGNQAMTVFNYLNPITHSDSLVKADQYRVEPYVIAADVYSVAPYMGRGGWTWYTGSASWMYRLGTEALLGFSRHGDHLVIEPCIPHDWEHYQMTYQDGPTSYEIHVENPRHVCRGVIAIMVDGLAVVPGPIQMLHDSATHQIVIKLG